MSVWVNEAHDLVKWDLVNFFFFFFEKALFTFFSGGGSPTGIVSWQWTLKKKRKQRDEIFGHVHDPPANVQISKFVTLLNLWFKCENYHPVQLKRRVVWSVTVARPQRVSPALITSHSLRTEAGYKQWTDLTWKVLKPTVYWKLWW